MSTTRLYLLTKPCIEEGYRGYEELLTPYGFDTETLLLMCCHDYINHQGEPYAGMDSFSDYFTTEMNDSYPDLDDEYVDKLFITAVQYRTYLEENIHQSLSHILDNEERLGTIYDGYTDVDVTFKGKRDILIKVTQ